MFLGCFCAQRWQACLTANAHAVGAPPFSAQRCAKALCRDALQQHDCFDGSVTSWGLASGEPSLQLLQLVSRYSHQLRWTVVLLPSLVQVPLRADPTAAAGLCWCSTTGSPACAGDNLSDTEVNVGMHKNIIEALEAARNPLQHVYFNAGEGFCISVASRSLEEVAACGVDAVWLCIAGAWRSLQTDPSCRCCTAAPMYDASLRPLTGGTRPCRVMVALLDRAEMAAACCSTCVWLA